jgi:threonine synthase
VASAIRIAAPAHAATAAGAVRASGGRVVTLTDEAILQAWQELAREEGVFCEPASAAGLAALDSAALEPGSTVVCVITGHGLKDPETATRLTPAPDAVDPDPDAIEAASR